ncbi:MAG: hypothetical protein DRP45_11055 [Candidatus Zixiibacteriota bacterium]|nr:MAG: hypothetical protein DRP45_11055 [candidate division Zixibacteria bacterium]
MDESAFTDQRLFGEADLLWRLTSSELQKQQLCDQLAYAAGMSSPLEQRIGVSLKQQRLKLARNTARFLPRIGLQASFDFQNELSETGGFEEEPSSWSIGTRFELPLFLGGSRFKERQGLRAGLGELEYLRDDTHLQVAADIRVGLRRLLNLATNFPPAVRSAELAETYLELLFDQYAGGRQTLLEMLDALQNDREAGLKAVNTQLDYFEAAAELLHEIGWRASENNRTPDQELLTRLSEIRQSGN